MFFKGFYKLFKFQIPIFTETTDEGIFKKFIDVETEFLTTFASCLAHLPTVVVEGHRTIGESLLTNRIEVAADGFGPRGAAFAEGLFGGTKAERASPRTLFSEDDVSVGIEVAVAGKNAILAVDDGCDKVAFRVDGAYAFAVDDATGLGTEIVPYLGKDAFEVVYLLHRDGGTGLAFDAALTAAGLKVAAEIFGKNVGRNENVANLEDR